LNKERPTDVTCFMFGLTCFECVTQTHIEPEQYTHTHSQAPEDECTSIRNILSKK